MSHSSIISLTLLLGILTGVISAWSVSFAEFDISGYDGLVNSYTINAGFFFGLALAFVLGLHKKPLHFIGMVLGSTAAYFLGTSFFALLVADQSLFGGTNGADVFIGIVAFFGAGAIGSGLLCWLYHYLVRQNPMKDYITAIIMGMVMIPILPLSIAPYSEGAFYIFYIVWQSVMLTWFVHISLKPLQNTRSS